MSKNQCKGLPQEKEKEGVGREVGGEGGERWSVMMMLRVVRAGTRPRHDQGRLDSKWTTPAFPHLRSL